MNFLGKEINKNRGFTLAEVLIVMGIIGIIAEMVIPSVIQNSVEQITVSQVKKTYATLSGAYIRAVQENGPPSTWGLTADQSGGVTTMLNMLKPYLNVSKDCSSGTTGCFQSTPYLNLDNTALGLVLNGGRSLLLADGTGIYGYNIDSADCTLAWVPAGNVCGRIYVDVNGFKGPNVRGKDLFDFFMTNSAIYPVGFQQSSVNFTGNCITAAGNYGSGMACTGWVLYNENLDYVECPVTLKNGWSGPKKCN